MERIRESIWVGVLCCWTFLSPWLSAGVTHSGNASHSPAGDGQWYPEVQSLGDSVILRIPIRGRPEEYFQLFNNSWLLNYRGSDYLRVRGSRQDEIGYQFGGVDIRSLFSGNAAVRFIPEAMESLFLDPVPGAIQGAFPSAVGSYLTTPTSKPHVTLCAESDQFTSPYRSVAGSYSYGYRDVTLVGGGSLLSNRQGFVAAAEVENFDDHFRKFWKGFTIGEDNAPLITDGARIPLSQIVGNGELKVRPGNIPEAGSQSYLFNGKLTYVLRRIPLQFISALEYRKSSDNMLPIQNLFD